MTTQFVTPLEPREYPVVYGIEAPADDGTLSKVYIIETSDTEAIFVMAMGEEAASIKYNKKRPCINIKEAKSAYRNIEIIDNSDGKYSQVMVNPSEEVELMFDAFVYFPNEDVWEFVEAEAYNFKVNKMTIDNPGEGGLPRYNNITEEEINKYIAAAQ